MVGDAAASLLPTGAFLAARTGADVWGDVGRSAVADIPGTIPLLLVVVSLPSLLPISAATTGRTRMLVAAGMAAVAAIAGVAVATDDDAQAGLAVLTVPYVAVPLGLASWTIRSLLERRSRTASGRRLHVRLPDRLVALLLDAVS